MTTQRSLETRLTEGQESLEPLPDPPRSYDMQQNKHIARTDQTLETWFHGRRERVLVNGQGYLCRERRDARSSPHPDCVVAFDVDAKRITDSNGYVISEVGKPPEFVLEVASRTTGKRDYIQKRVSYARLGVGEYWRFDYSGGRYHDVALAGDRLVDGSYVPFPITRETDGVIWGYSPTLELALCWMDQELLFYDPTEGIYLPNQLELKAQRDDAEARAAEARQEAEKLREQLRRLQP